MRIGEVIGEVTLSRCHPSFVGATLKVVRPLTLENLTGEVKPDGEPLVAWDELGAGHGSRIAYSDGAEAAQPFRPELKPVDAYNAAILDTINIE
ncbi:MAG: EutN/CcmL family microcompartment protein [Pirellulaceae bacterium]|jgi:ethanolamine utilization protein EutN|nr:EutN/CcmL family microcompartment protein [Pirellulaceae bacterium]MDP7019416.1 EutN/CcmL family microcompartment protein [Pirellulaceae bacterium]